MSKDQESPRSRRALRLEREARGGTPDSPPDGYPSVPLIPAPASDSDRNNQQDAEGPQRVRRRRAADSPVDAPVEKPGERQSQARARDREALRAYKALSEQETKKGSSAPLTRRQLRQQQLEAERRAAGLSTSRLPIVPPAASSAPDDSSTTDDSGTTDDDTGAKERDDAQSPPVADDSLNDLSVEQALAARSALVEQAKNQMAMLDASGEQNPETVDLEVLAEQRKLAERAAILNQRAMTKQRLSEQNSQGKPQQNDPTSAHNLAMVTPLEFVKVPGVEQPVMKPPTTSHIPVITSTTHRVPPAEPKPRIPARPVPGPQAPGDATDGTADGPVPGEDAGSSTDRRSRVLARAEEVARTGPSEATPAARQIPRLAARPEPIEEGGPISAHTAHGLEPLDAMTAGMGRGKRQRLLQVLTIAIGAIALLVGLIMILGG